MPVWLRILLIVILIILIIMIYNGQTTEAANIVGGIIDIVVKFATNLGRFFGKLFD